jgi:hypothetical protein
VLGVRHLTLDEHEVIGLQPPEGRGAKLRLNGGAGK